MQTTAPGAGGGNDCLEYLPQSEAAESGLMRVFRWMAGTFWGLGLMLLIDPVFMTTLIGVCFPVGAAIITGCFIYDGLDKRGWITKWEYAAIMGVAWTMRFGSVLAILVLLLAIASARR